MKRLLSISLLMLCLACGTLRAQRCLPGTWSVELSAGSVDGLLLRDEHSAHSFFGRLTWSRYRRNLNRWTFGMTYLRKDYPYKHVNVPMAQFTAEAGYFTPLLSDRRRRIVFSAGMSLAAGYETTGCGQKLLFDGATLRNRDGFVFGPMLSAELEGFVCDRLSLCLMARERCLFGRTVGNFHTELGVGIKFLIR